MGPVYSDGAGGSTCDVPYFGCCRISSMLWNSCGGNASRTGGSSRRTFAFLDVQLRPFGLERRHELPMRFERSVRTAFCLVLFTGGNAAIDGAPLRRRVLIGNRWRLRDDHNHASSSCPLLNPAVRRTAGGTTSGILLLFFTATVMIVPTPEVRR